MWVYLDVELVLEPIPLKNTLSLSLEKKKSTRIIKNI